MSNTSSANGQHKTATLARWILVPPPGTRFTHIRFGDNPCDLHAAFEYEIGRDKEMINWFRQMADAKEQELLAIARMKQSPVRRQIQQQSLPIEIPPAPSSNPIMHNTEKEPTHNG